MTHGTDTEPVVAVVVAYALIDLTEVEAPRTARVFRVERGGPVAAGGACAEEIRAIAVAGGGQEDRVAIMGGEPAAVDVVEGRPLYGGVVYQFLPFLSGRGAGSVAQKRCGGVVTGLQYRKAVHRAVFCNGVVLGQRFHDTLAVHRTVAVSTPFVVTFRLCLAPGKVVAVVLRIGSTNIVTAPKQSARQPEIDPFDVGAAATTTIVTPTIITATVVITVTCAASVVVLLAASHQ